ncbi:clip domain serine protease 4-like protein, partial [Leptotrombidium deliense]
FNRIRIAPIYRLNDTFCQHVYRANYIKDSVFCAGNFEHKSDGCMADTGATLFRKINETYFATGIASFDDECQFNSLTSVYTNVMHFVPWIQKHTNNTLIKLQN